jgi:hypothetical protein
MLRRSGGRRLTSAPGNALIQVHPGEWWVVLAHAVAFGSAYVFGASNASFLLVLAVHHEVQYLYFTYAMAWRSEGSRSARSMSSDTIRTSASATAPLKVELEFRSEVRRAGSFLRWPVVGFAAAVGGGWLELTWLAPLGVGGLFCHYWLDGRIWTRRSLNG